MIFAKKLSTGRHREQLAFIHFFLFALFLIVFIKGNPVYGQDNREPHRLSIGVMGGILSGHMNSVPSFPSNSEFVFEFKEAFTFLGGLHLRYTVNPSIAAQFSIHASKISILNDNNITETSITAQNKFVATSLNLQLNLLELFGGNTDYFNVYTNLGTGLLFNSVIVNNMDASNNEPLDPAVGHPGQTLFNIFGAGIGMNLLSNVNIYMQFDYNVASNNLIDEVYFGRTLGTDHSIETSNQWSSLSIGVQFKLNRGQPNIDRNSRELSPTTPFPNNSSEPIQINEDELQMKVNALIQEIDSLKTSIQDLLVLTMEKNSSNTLTETGNIYGLKGEYSEPVSNSFSINVYSFLNKNRAITESEKLRADEYRVFINSKEINGVTYWRVSIGIFRTRDDALNAIRLLPAAFQNEYFIQKFE